MNERPILFSAPMVRAILAGNKTQTRRIAKHVVGVHAHTGEPLADLDSAGPRVPCPYGQVGDRLWVRETWRGVVEISHPDAPVKYGVAHYVPDQQHCRRVEYAATQAHDGEPWRPNIHMPRWACRILLEITGVRVERLQDGEGEAAWESRYLAEGIHKIDHGRGDHYFSALRNEPHPKNWADPFDAWRELWSTTGGNWEANPWVWVIEFRRIK